MGLITYTMARFFIKVHDLCPLFIVEACDLVDFSRMVHLMKCRHHFIETLAKTHVNSRAH